MCPGSGKRGCALRKGIRLALSVFVMVMVWSSPLRAAAPLDSLYERFKVDLPSADIVVLLDASGSMGEKYLPCRQAVVEFVQRLTAKEQLHLRVFGDVPEAPLDEGGDQAARRVEGFLRRQPFPAERRGSDLGMAIHKGLEFLERKPASRVQALFLLTDGLHQVFPHIQSPYSRDFDADPNWQELYRRGHALSQTHTVFVYGFGLGKRTDIALLRRVFPARSVELIPGNAAAVAHVLERVRERMRREQLRPAVERELARGKVEARLPKASISGNVFAFDLPLTVRNAYSRLPVRIEQVRMTRTGSGSQEIRCELERMGANGVLAPGGEREGRIHGTLRAELPRRLGKAERRFESRFTLTPVATFVDETALRELGIRPATPTRGYATLTCDLRVRYGISYWFIATPALIVVTMAGAAVIRRRREEERLKAVAQRHAERSRLQGKLKIWNSGEGEPLEDGKDLAVKQSQQLALALTDAGTLEVTLPGEAQSREVVARLSGHLIGATQRDAESGKPEYRLKAVAGHALTYESGGQMRTADELSLCNYDLLEIDDRWRLRYVNESLRTRAEVESSQ